MRFLTANRLNIGDFAASKAIEFLRYLREMTPRKPQGLQRGFALVASAGDVVSRLSPASINRALAAVSSFYEYLIMTESWFSGNENPIQKQYDPESARVSDRHRPFMGLASRQKPIRRVLKVRTAQRVPRPLDSSQTQQILESIKLWRDRAMILLMLNGGLRPGEVLNLHLEDIQYGRSRLIVRYRTDHPRGVRTKSRIERVVDLLDGETLRTVSHYVMNERPQDTQAQHVFLVGGNRADRTRPLSYHALIKMFERRCAEIGLRFAWLTPHALRHTHATQMWEGGMRELALQKRLGHASPESTRIYTRVSDKTLVKEYLQALGKREHE
jgi:integrase